MSISNIEKLKAIISKNNNIKMIVSKRENGVYIGAVIALILLFLVQMYYNQLHNVHNVPNVNVNGNTLPLKQILNILVDLVILCLLTATITSIKITEFGELDEIIEVLMELFLNNNLLQIFFIFGMYNIFMKIIKRTVVHYLNIRPTLIKSTLDIIGLFLFNGFLSYYGIHNEFIKYILITLNIIIIIYVVYSYVSNKKILDLNKLNTDIIYLSIIISLLISK